jgi:hypothetical protein
MPPQASTARPLGPALALTLGLLLAACAPAGAPVTSTQPPASATPLPPAATLAPTTEVPVSYEALAGMWMIRDYYELNFPDGTFRAGSLGEVLRGSDGGRMTIEGDQVTFDETLCPNIPGVYRVDRLNATEARMTAISDDCPERRDNTSGLAWKRLEPAMPPGAYTTSIMQAEADAAGGDLGQYAGEWRLELSEGLQLTLMRNGEPVGEGTYVMAGDLIALVVDELCPDIEPVGQFRIRADAGGFIFSRRAECPAVNLVFRTHPWTPAQ